MFDSIVKDTAQLIPYPIFPMETMGDRIRQLRVARGYSQEELGSLVGVSKSAVSQWELGATKNIKLETFLRVVEILHTDANYLIWGKDRVRPRVGSSGGGKLHDKGR
jgi:transcriptional regulator with XRE-family HTH domain